jgi:pimeloyl-ACP methyl ester carboxylesterase
MSLVDEEPENFREVLGKKLAHVDVSDGQPVVFLRGNPASSNVIPEVAPLACTVAPDLVVGHDWSGWLWIGCAATPTRHAVSSASRLPGARGTGARSARPNATSSNGYAHENARGWYCRTVSLLKTFFQTGSRGRRPKPK